MIRAVIFDMDGVLIDSEPFWRLADIEIFAKEGLFLTDEMCRQTMGMTCIESVQYWYNKHPWENANFHEISDAIENHVVKNILEKGEKLKGVDEIIGLFEKKNIPIGLASSSSIFVIEAVLKRLQLKHKFTCWHSAQFEEAGKPHPAVFLTTARKLCVKPYECLVFEDSINGIKAAKAAGMITIAVPEPHTIHDNRFSIADMVIPSLSDYNDEMLIEIASK